MDRKISLKSRLIIWYSIVLGVSLATFAGLFYYFVTSQFLFNIDKALRDVAFTITDIIELNQSNLEFFKIKPSSDSNNIAKAIPDVLNSKKSHKHHDTSIEQQVWAAIYDQVSLSARNYLIQVSDANNRIVWKSLNLKEINLPRFTKNKEIDSTFKRKYDYMPLYIYKPAKYKQGDSLFIDAQIENSTIRVFILQRDNYTIAVGYSLDNVYAVLNIILNFFLMGFPVILILSSVGGYFLAKFSMKPIDKLATAASDITASNLSMRLQSPGTKDEIDRLTVTLNNMIQRLDQSFTQIKQFTSDASHELKTPLTILRGELEIALTKSDTIEDYQYVIASSLDEVIRLTNVVEALLELSRADSGQLKLDKKKDDISKLLNDLTEDIEILAEEKEIRVISHIDPDLVCHFDSARMHQALLNLMDNAVKYTPEGGKIFIYAEKDINNIKISIIDTGIGIPEDQLPSIYDRFFRVDKARNSRIQGTGLGLSIVKWILDAHYAQINVKSALNKGSSFEILLPL